MKKNKALALAMACAMTATTFMSVASVHALEASEMTVGYDLVYNVDKSDADTRAVDVYVVSPDAAIKNFTLAVSVPAGVVSSATSDWKADFDPTVSRFNDNGTVALYSISASSVQPESEQTDWFVNSTGVTLLTTLYFEVANADVTFDASIMSGKIYKTTVTQKDVLTVPAFVTEPTDTRSDFEAATAEKIGTYDADTTTVPVAAWVAEIDYSSVKLADGASLVWKVDTATVDTVSGTTVSGEGSVFYGLAIAGRADQLSTIETVQLVAE